MLRLIAFISLAAIGADRVSEPATPRLFTPACHSADFGTNAQIAWWKHKMHSTNPSDSVDVSRANLLYVADTSFAVVTDSTTCATLLAGHNLAAGYTPTQLSSPDASGVYAIRIGTRYVTWNPAFGSGEYVRHVVWNSSFTPLAQIY